MAVAAKLLDADEAFSKAEFIVHGAWLPRVWWHCLFHSGFSLFHSSFVRMPHGAFDPVRLGYHGWKKRLVGPIERWLLRRASKVLATCEAERRWILAYEPRAKVEVVDLKQYFKFVDAKIPTATAAKAGDGNVSLKLLYLGRIHPLKGIDYLKAAVDEVNRKFSNLPNFKPLELRIVSDAVGEDKERAWKWCDLLVLPTLSENFGLVIAEALARGIPVLTTDGAPAWSDTPGVTVLAGFRAAAPAVRVEMLVSALQSLA